jgi:plasmid stabilization system protein ParE
MGWQVIIAPSAQNDLADIVCYVAQHNSDAAARLGYELITRAERLADFPEIGRMVPDSDDLDRLSRAIQLPKRGAPESALRMPI